MTGAFTVAPNPAESVLCTFLALNTSLEIRKRHGDAEEWRLPNSRARLSTFHLIKYFPKVRPKDPYCPSELGNETDL